MSIRRQLAPLAAAMILSSCAQPSVARSAAAPAIAAPEAVGTVHARPEKDYWLLVASEGNDQIALTIAHGTPFGFLWKYATKNDSLAGRVMLGNVLTHDRYAFVTQEGVGSEPGAADVIDLRTLTKVATIDIGQPARGIDFWKTTAPR